MTARAALACTLLTALLFASFVPILATAEPHRPCPDARNKHGTGNVCSRGNGLLEVYSPDWSRSLGFVHEAQDPFIGPESGGPGGSGSGATRAPVCAPSTAGNYYIRVVYARPSDLPNLYTLRVDSIRNIVQQANAIVNDAAVLTGGGTTGDLKVKCTNGVIDVASVALPTPATSADFSTITNDLRNDPSGAYNDVKVKYWVYYDDQCPDCAGGQGNIDQDESRSVNNKNNGNALIPFFAVSFGDMSAHTFLHELTHNMGGVHRNAPHSTDPYGLNPDNGWHCYDGLDVMCYDDLSFYGDRLSSTVCSSETWDCNKDDYFNANPAAGTYLANNWNIGSTLNRYIQFVTPPSNAASATVKIFDSGGVNVLRSYTATPPALNYYRFSVATAGWNDPDPATGKVVIDDLTINRADGSQTTYSFASAPSILESSTGSAHNALQPGSGNIEAVGNTNYGCPSNYESINVAGTIPSSITKAKFKFNRPAGTGDGSWWDLYIGVAPTDAEAIVNQGCTNGSHSGQLDNFIGIHVGGDGEGNRHYAAGRVDLSEDATQTNMLLGTTTYWAEVTIVPGLGPQLPPTTPLNVVASSANSRHQIALNWAPPSGGSAPAGYKVWSSPTSTGTFSILVGPGNVNSLVDFWLEDATQRCYKVSAYNSMGESSLSAATCASSWSVPGVPRNVDARTGTNAGEITVSWLAPTNTGGSPFYWYRVYRSSSSGGPYYEVRDDLWSYETSWTDTGLGNGATYYYKVLAWNSIGDGPLSLYDWATTYYAPSAPQWLDAAPGSSLNTIRVTWSPPNDLGGGLSGYRLYRSVDSGGYSLRASLGSGTTSYTDSGLTQTSTYRYYAKAYNPAGESWESNNDCARPWPVGTSTGC